MNEKDVISRAKLILKIYEVKRHDALKRINEFKSHDVLSDAEMDEYKKEELFLYNLNSEQEATFNGFVNIGVLDLEDAISYVSEERRNLGISEDGKRLKGGK